MRVIGGDRLIDADEAATVLGMTGAAVRKAAAGSTIPTEQLGRRLRFRLSALLAQRNREQVEFLLTVPLEVKNLLKEGASLSVDDAEQLERDLEQRPDDLDARARLVGYYEARGKGALKANPVQMGISFGLEGAPQRQVVARHALWIAAHAPRTPLAAHFHFSTYESVYAELSSIWRRHVAADPPDAAVFANAIEFFWWPNEIFADELLVRGEELFPGDVRWVNFRRRRRAHELELAFQYQPLRDRGLAPGRDVGAAEGRTDKALDEIEQLLREGDRGA